MVMIKPDQDPAYLQAKMLESLTLSDPAAFYPESLNTSKPPALPAKTEERRTAGASSVEPEGLTIAEAVARFEVGANTLRRWLRRGELPGAVRVPSSKGDTYRIPLAALEGRGLKPRGGEAVGAKASLVAVATLSADLAKARADTERAEAALREAEDRARLLNIVRNGLAAELDAEREKLRLVSEAQSDLRRALLILESEQQKRTRAEQEAARSFFSWLRHRKAAKGGEAVGTPRVPGEFPGPPPR